MAEGAVENQRPVMPRKLLKAAIEGNKQVVTQMLRLQEDSYDDTNVTIDDAWAEHDSSSSDGDQHHDCLQSATFMGNTVLHVVCSNDHDVLAYKICMIDYSLLKARNKMLETPLHCAAKAGCTSTIGALLEYAEKSVFLSSAEEIVRERNCHGETALHEAARHNHEGIVKKLMEVDPELVYELDNYGISALEIALARGNNEMVKILMENFSDQKMLNARKRSSRADRHTYAGNVENAENAHNPINMSTSASILRSPPIHLVASVGNIDGAKLLLQSDPSLAYLQDADGLFPIHVAARMGHVDMVILFMQSYLDSCELLDHCGRNFLHMAAEANKFTVFTKLFTKSNEDTLPSFLVGMFTGMINAIDNPPSIDMPTAMINTTDDPLLVGMLTAMINTTDNEGNTPLHIAAEKGCKLVMKALMANEKLDVGLQNRRGLTPFDISVIQVKESTENSLGIQDRIEQYVQRRGAKITSSWLNNFIRPASTRSSGDGKDADNFIGQLQIIGLGAVLITTVTFAAAFTLPGGSMDFGSPVLGRKYVFKAFILADTFAFLQSFFCTVMLMFGGLSSIDPGAKNMFLSLTLFQFSSAARSMVLAFGLGLYLVIAPISRGFGIVILFMVLSSVLIDVSSRVVITCINNIVDFKELFEDSPGSDVFFARFSSSFHLVGVILPFFCIFIFALVH